MSLLKIIITLISTAVVLIALYVLYIYQIAYPLPGSSGIEQDFIISIGVKYGECRCKQETPCTKEAEGYQTAEADINEGKFDTDKDLLRQILSTANASSYGRCHALLR